MSVQALLTTLLLPPLGCALLALLAGVLAWRRGARAGLWVTAAMLVLLALAMPSVAGLLVVSLERGLPGAAVPPVQPGAIIILGGDMAAGEEVGALTLERLRAGAALARRVGLPVLVTGGPQRPGGEPLAALMARSLAEDFGVTVRWTEPAAQDTRENAAFGVALLRADGIGAAYLVSHGWHLARAGEAFARRGFPVVPVPVRLRRLPDGQIGDWVPRADHLGTSWYALREWAGRLVYALRDG